MKPGLGLPMTSTPSPTGRAGLDDVEAQKLLADAEDGAVPQLDRRVAVDAHVDAVERLLVFDEQLTALEASAWRAAARGRGPRRTRRRPHAPQA